MNDVVRELLRELLREAKNHVPPPPFDVKHRGEEGLHARIDAALAQTDDQPDAAGLAGELEEFLVSHLEGDASTHPLLSRVLAALRTDQPEADGLAELAEEWSLVDHREGGHQNQASYTKIWTELCLNGRHVAHFPDRDEAETILTALRADRPDYSKQPRDDGVSKCNKCGAEYPSAPAGTIHKCGACRGYCSPIASQTGSVTDELKPCPFCGGEASMTSRTDEDLSTHNQVEWKKVGCDECEVYFEMPDGYDSGTSTEQWNARA